MANREPLALLPGLLLEASFWKHQVEGLALDVDVEVRVLGDHPGGGGAVLPDEVVAMIHAKDLLAVPVHQRGEVAVADLASLGLAQVGRLMLNRPDLTTAQRIAETIVAELGEGSAQVEDPGAVAVVLPPDENPAAVLAAIVELEVTPDAIAQVVIDARDGTVAAGGPLRVGPGVVSHGYLTLTVGAEDDGPPAEGALRMEPGVRVQDVVEALHAVGATPESIAAVFESLHRVGAIRARVVVR